MAVMALGRGSPAPEDSSGTKEREVPGDSRLESHQRNQDNAAGERLLPAEVSISRLDGLLHRSWVG